MCVSQTCWWWWWTREGLSVFTSCFCFFERGFLALGLEGGRCRLVCTGSPTVSDKTKSQFDTHINTQRKYEMYVTLTCSDSLEGISSDQFSPFGWSCHCHHLVSSGSDARSGPRFRQLSPSSSSSSSSWWRQYVRGRLIHLVTAIWAQSRRPIYHPAGLKPTCWEVVVGSAWETLVPAGELGPRGRDWRGQRPPTGRRGDHVAQVLHEECGARPVGAVWWGPGFLVSVREWCQLSSAGRGPVGGRRATAVLGKQQLGGWWLLVGQSGVFGCPRLGKRSVQISSCVLCGREIRCKCAM